MQKSYIDFHTHILPEIDDGCRTVEESISLLQESARQEVRLIVLTPHFYADRDTPSHFFERRDTALGALQKNWREKTPILVLGAEVVGKCYGRSADSEK